MTESKPVVEPSLRQAYLDAMAQMAFSVSIVATDGVAGRDGVVVSAITSVSADAPRPLLLICLNQSGRVPDRLLRNGLFSVNVLAQEQQSLAERFAGRSEMARESWFSDPDWQVSDSGMPILGSALSQFECEVTQSSLVGTHHVIFGAVRAAYTQPEGRPLVHAQRRFHRLHD